MAEIESRAGRAVEAHSASKAAFSEGVPRPNQRDRWVWGGEEAVGGRGENQRLRRHL